MAGATVDVQTDPDGTLVIRPRGVLGMDDAIELRRALIRAIRHTHRLRHVGEGSVSTS